MNSLRLSVSLLGLALLPSAMRADQLDDLIAAMKSDAPPPPPERVQEKIQEGLRTTSSAVSTAIANSYLAQVKASILDEANHGGWPCRSTYVYTPNYRSVLTQRLRFRFDQQPSPILAYAIICPAIYAQDNALLERALAYLKENDAFLSSRAESQMREFWLPFITSVLKRQTPPTKAAFKDPTAPKNPSDDPFSVLPGKK